MCGRFALSSIPKSIFDEFVIVPPPVRARYNIAPTQHAPVVLQDSGHSPALENLYWGLIPSWAKDKSGGVRAINARAETVAEKPAFRDAFRHRRCLIPATGFYEWKREGRIRTPYYFTSDSKPLVIAGLWECWRGDEGTVRSFTIITTGANGTMAAIHDRMPVILPKRSWRKWLEPGNGARAVLQALLHPAPDDLLQCRAVSDYVNNSKHEGGQCIE